ncbi:MAG: RNA polymerase sigma factor [Saprospiraceae bacterium]
MKLISFSNSLHEHKERLNTFAFSLTKNADDAKDLYQETMLRALRNESKFEPGTNLKAWLMTIMRNIFINDYRKKSKNRVLFDSTDNLYFLNSGHTQISNQGENNMLSAELNTILNELDKSLKYPFLKHFEGFKYQEIAQDMKLPLGTVKSRIYFARQELKGKIENRYGKVLGVRDLAMKMAC